MGSARFKEDWHPLTNSTMESQVKKMMALFQDLPFGPFKMAEWMFGKQRARELAAQRLCIPPPSEEMSVRQLQTPGERMQGTKQRLDDDNEEFIVISEDEQEDAMDTDGPF